MDHLWDTEWFPMTDWNAILVFLLVSWFAMEAAGWAPNLLPDDVRQRQKPAWLPHDVMVKNVVAQRIPGRQHATSTSAAPPPTVAEAPFDGDCHTGGHLVVSNRGKRAVMATMALSMGYMFYGMELLAMAMLSAS